jgi:malonyl-CoA/methylmalonyl-CoA synthetase
MATGNRYSEAMLHAWRSHLGSEFDPDVLLGELSTGTLSRAFHDTAIRYPERVALEVDGEKITHGELDSQASSVGGWLSSRGLGSGQVVLLCGDSSIEFVIAYLGILRAGCIALPTGTGLTEHELRYLLQDSGAVAAMVQDEALIELLAGSHEGAISTIVSLVEGMSAAQHTLREIVSEGLPAEPPDCSQDAPAMLAYTSGTTGQPKGVPLTHANLLSSIRGAMRAWGWSDDDVLVHALPFSHQHGLSGVHAALLSGSRTVVHSRFEPQGFSETVASERATVIFAVPAIYERLVGWEGVSFADYSSLRLAVCGSSPLSPPLARKVAAVIGQQVLERYGSTETGLDVSNPYNGPRRDGSVGLPLPGVEMAIVNDEGQQVKVGEEGEIVLRGPQVFSGYLGMPEATWESFFDRGWFRTGDVGHTDADEGYLYITGRTKEMIISGGVNIYPREIELVLEEHGEVDQAAVVGVPSERWGEEVVAFVVMASENATDGSELARHVRSKLSAHKCPKRFLRSTQLPRNEMGKLLRDELVDTAEQSAYVGEL